MPVGQGQTATKVMVVEDFDDGSVKLRRSKVVWQGSDVHRTQEMEPRMGGRFKVARSMDYESRNLYS